MRVLLIDDDEDLRVAMRLALKSSGIASDSYGSCDAAMAAMAESDARPDAILLDLHLDGAGTTPEAFISWLRSGRLGDVPVLLVTAAHNAATRTRELGANGYLAKPFDVGTLLQRVATLIGRN
jgi:DNA-binding response OmpR family regulator